MRDESELREDVAKHFLFLVRNLVCYETVNVENPNDSSVPQMVLEIVKKGKEPLVVPIESMIELQNGLPLRWAISCIVLATVHAEKVPCRHDCCFALLLDRG